MFLDLGVDRVMSELEKDRIAKQDVINRIGHLVNRVWSDIDFPAINTIRNIVNEHLYNMEPK